MRGKKGGASVAAEGGASVAAEGGASEAAEGGASVAAERINFLGDTEGIVWE